MTIKITLLSKNSTGEKVAHQASAICIGKFKTATQKNMEVAVKANHLSILEHLYFSVLIEGVSRSLTHQLVRHRIASYTQESQRYVKLQKDSGYEKWYIQPESFDAHSARYEILMKSIASFYEELLEQGVTKEDARMILPNSCKTSIIVTMNLRSFIEQSQKRLCAKAQWEIRDLFLKMRRVVREEYHVLKTAGNIEMPPCFRNACNENKEHTLHFCHDTHNTLYNESMSEK